MSFMMFFGLACVILAIVLIGLSKYRYWLVFMGAGAAFWASVEVISLLAQYAFDINVMYGYLVALLVVLGVITCLVFFHDRKNAVKTQYIEHTPVYDDEPCVKH